MHEPLAACCRIKLIRSLCCDAWLGQNCSLQIAWKEEGGRRGQKWEDPFYNPSLLIFSLHVIPTKAENNEQRAAEGGESQVQPWTPPLEGSIGLGELRPRWLPGCRVTSVSAILCDGDVDFFFFFFLVFSICIYFKECSRWAAHLKTCRTTQWMWNVCFPQKCVRLKTLGSWIRKFWWDSGSTYFWPCVLGQVPWPCWDLLFSSAEWDYECLSHLIIDGTQGSRLSTVLTSQ